ncbi:RagB/SusD family nutrient uptake outer membrane protein [Flavivirga sp. 57AJ16]|uniref:RagB/SusD family nutrient uptake outer membrane protein n=1 Tax=Flavivirga sp. 57AJ16 TaxID=3025307 RepID=UPI0023671D21|nr:RagB/SusD family nutrient uptake outer membrane protein [Flavivirga sp. 57AJ16]MDD7886283.1 RagB/SusD family nutrient uptake outer membrane protein [Flavivirga sp. 57AJ16]
MKKIVLLLILPFIMQILVSCSEEELVQKNPNQLATEEFWVSENDAELGINSVYAMFYKAGLWTRWIYFRLDLTSDEGFSKSPWIELADWTRFNYINYNFFEGNGETWRDTYKAVFRCNQVLANVPNIEFTSQEKKNQILSQAKFFRALHYYYAAILWENIPLVLEPSSPNDIPEQRTQQEIFAQVEKDLTEAIIDLPVQWDADNKGRATKGAAYALLGKVYMQQHKWTEAKQALDWLVTGAGSSNYDLVANFQDNFRGDNENNLESVFEIQFADDPNRQGDQGEAAVASVSTQRSQFFAPRGIGWSDGQARYWLVDEFKKEANLDGGLDMRLRYSLIYDDMQADWGLLTYGRTWQWEDGEAWFRKYQRDYYRDSESNWSEVNNRLIRYADVLLMYAEVLNELDMTSDAYQYVNRVRARANMATLQSAYPAIGNDKTAFRDRLKMERVLELCGESGRWADLKRWGDLDNQASVNVIAQRDPDFNNFVVGKHHRLPIPQDEVQNNPNLDQHPEY